MGLGKVVFLVFILFISGCTLLPSKEYIISGKIDPNTDASIIDGEYVIDESSLVRLNRILEEQNSQIITESSIKILKSGTEILFYNCPKLADLLSNEIIITNDTSELLLRKGEVFWHLKTDFRDDTYLKYRTTFLQESILLNLANDPDYTDYYNYRKK